jgi:hypothetical protein
MTGQQGGRVDGALGGDAVAALEPGAVGGGVGFEVVDVVEVLGFVETGG